MDIFYYKSPIGILEIKIEDNFVFGLNIVETCGNLSERVGYFAEVARELDEYFLGKRHKFDFKINPVGTEFQRKVWTELLKIPYGQTKSYQDIAKAVGNKDAQRAIGNACNKNPILIIIPCHRVISKNGNLTGFACGVDIKEKLLDFENAKFVNYN